MPTAASKSEHRKPSRRRAAARTRDPEAIALLKQDHRQVEALFKAYEGLEDDKEKLATAQKICLALKVHAQIEEEILYPAERGEVDDDTLDEAFVEHAGIKKLVAELEGASPTDEFYDAKVQVLGEYVTHHVKEEESEMFPQAKKSDLNLDGVGAKLAARKQELMKQFGAKPN
jgi:hemerythrin superfamily protein